MKARLIKYGLSAWFLGFCLLICLALTDEIKARPVCIETRHDRVGE